MLHRANYSIQHSGNAKIYMLNLCRTSFSVDHLSRELRRKKTAKQLTLHNAHTQRETMKLLQVSRTRRRITPPTGPAADSQLIIA